MSSPMTALAGMWAATGPGPVAQVLATVVGLYSLIIFVMLIMSWFPMRPGGGAAQFYGVLVRITDPVLGPVRRAMPSTGPLDLSPLVVLLALQLLRQLILS